MKVHVDLWDPKKCHTLHEEYTRNMPSCMRSIDLYSSYHHFYHLHCLSTEYYRILSDTTGYYRILPNTTDTTEYYRILPILVYLILTLALISCTWMVKPEVFIFRVLHIVFISVALHTYPDPISYLHATLLLRSKTKLYITYLLYDLFPLLDIYAHSSGQSVRWFSKLNYFTTWSNNDDLGNILSRA